MSWSIRGVGTNEEMQAFVTKQYSYPKEGDQSQIEAAKEFIQAELARIPLGRYVFIEAGGHHNGQEASNVYIRLEMMPDLAK